ncbi:hypothetical protein FOMG_12972 [Fusarium oxysporum f. sp. melonis 26406]|uniref:Uncharacterized protein n=1 Tax=Fusarium oxysporum f. sp. melonis 26406 TaxID=1089452 RepID=W9ZRP2_FUSOX|nr:hypothetical protein FOMG_12972 [Fusarium oxysporum f. sp. melonis 26406]
MLHVLSLAYHGVTCPISNSTASSVAVTKAQQRFDHLAWTLNGEAWEKSYKRLFLKSTCHQVVSFVENVCDQTASLVPPITLGGYNVLYPVRCNGDGFDIVVRQPCPDLVQFREEKTRDEGATISYVAQNSAVRVPELFFHTSSSRIGPAMILLFIKSERSMSDALADPGQDPEEIRVLDPEIHEEDLRRLYGKMCRLLIQLLEPTLHTIGSLVEVGNNYSVAGRPITHNMNDMHNDLVDSEDDCRNKYVARYLFHLLAKKGHLSAFGFLEDNWSAQPQSLELSCSMPCGTDSFRLWCDDLRPHNILLDHHDNIVAALDWEFAYSAPTQFSLDPPWWLLLQLPELWPSGIDDWSQVYEARLRTWLHAMEDEEWGEGINFPANLSTYLRESWLSGRFWLDYATRKSWAFDTIFRK